MCDLDLCSSQFFDRMRCGDKGLQHLNARLQRCHGYAGLDPHGRLFLLGLGIGRPLARKCFSDASALRRKSSNLHAISAAAAARPCDSTGRGEPCRCDNAASRRSRQPASAPAARRSCCGVRCTMRRRLATTSDRHRGFDNFQRVDAVAITIGKE